MTAFFERTCRTAYNDKSCAFISPYYFYFYTMKNNSEGLEFLYRLVESLPDGILIIDEEGIITLVNKVLLDNLNIDGNITDHLDQHVSTLITQSDLSTYINSALDSGHYEFDIEQLRIKHRYFEIIAKSVQNGMIIIMHNITQNIKTKNTNLKNIFKGQEIEKKRLSKEIHDGIGPVLSSIKLGVDNVINKNPDEALSQSLRNISNQISEVAQDIRQISHALMPASLTDFGLVTAIENLISRIADSNSIHFTTKFEISDDDEVFTKEQELNLYRIIQEAINNGIKHGKAKNFNIEISNKTAHIQLIISDDGTGIELTKNSKDGIGLKNMRSRVASMNGRFSSKAIRPSGLQIKVKLPLNKQS